MKRVILLLFLVPLLAGAQDKGMKFEHGLSWKDIQAKAKAENKYIFMDCFTTWCGPCKFMSDKIFPVPEVGTFYNANYINVKVQLDTTATDNEEVKKWYQDGHDIMEKYEVRAFPTYLFFDPNGNIVHRSVGSSVETTFISTGEDALKPEKQYYTLLRKYEGGEKAPDFLYKLALAALSAYDRKKAASLSDEYLTTQSDLYTKENLKFLTDFTSGSKDKGFAIMLNNAEKVNAVLGKGAAEKIVMGIIVREEVYPVILKRTPETPDWSALSGKLKQKYPQYAPEAFSKAKVMYYQRKGDWNNFQTEAVAYMNTYGESVSLGELNSLAWTVFENCKDMNCVSQALEWSKRSFKDKENPMFIDTYANILYKLGKTNEAIEWQEKAVGLAAAEEKKDYQDTLEKMKKGEKTWKD